MGRSALVLGALALAGMAPVLEARPATQGAPEIHLGSAPYLTIGFRGEQVQAVKRALDFVGFDVGEIDDDFERKTDMAVRSLQRSAGLPVTGEVNEATLQALQKEMAARGGSLRFDSVADKADAGPTTLTMSALLPGTDYETPVYVYEGAQPGPTIVLVGGIHGNEHSGRVGLLAAINRGITLSAGRVVIVPEFNRIAVEQFRRRVDKPGSVHHNVDFNRMFPVGEEPTTPIARAMWDLLLAQNNLVLVVDYHDGFIMRRDGSARGLGNTFLRTGDERMHQISDMLVEAMEEIRWADAPGLEWRARGWPIDQSFIRKVGRDLGVSGLLVEMSAHGARPPHDPEELRIDYVWRMVRLMGREYGMTIGF